MRYLDALALKYKAEMIAAKTNIDVYLESPVGIGEHPDIVGAVEEQVKKYNDAKEMHSTIEELILSYTTETGAPEILNEEI